MSRFATFVVIVAALALCLVNAGEAQQAGTNWAVLVAGSNGYWNYRHQADICHAYQILKANGFKDEHIIVMMYDDIANNPQNPFPGTIINKPGGPNVYPGVPKDYVGNDVTPANFLKIISGQSMAGIGSGKTVKSTANDRIFINFSDHGGPGLVAFPTGDYLYAHDWIATLSTMYTKKQYKEMVIYVEACESGSMFNGLLPAEWNIYATTASDPTESSYACYYDSGRDAYLGDCYSVNWMEDDDKNLEATETLLQQFNIVKAETNESHVCQYGDLTINSEVLANFVSERNARFSGMRPAALPRRASISESTFEEAVTQYDAEMMTTMNMWKKAESDSAKVELGSRMESIFAARRTADELFRKIGNVAAEMNLNFAVDFALFPFTDRRAASTVDICNQNGYTAKQLECLKSLNQVLENGPCKFKYNDYSLKYTSVVSQLCAAEMSAETFSAVLARSC